MIFRESIKICLVLIFFSMYAQDFSSELFYFISDTHVLPLKPCYINTIKRQYNCFGNSQYFTKQFLKCPVWQKKALLCANSRSIELLTLDGKKISGYFIDRGASRALLIGQGFCSDKESLLMFLKLFPKYDILIIDYRWVNAICSLSMFITPLQKYILDATHEVYSAVQYLRNIPHKNYCSITGLGICYSALIYTIAQARTYIQEKRLLFDSLVLDSSFYSTRALVDAVIADPKLCWDNKQGGAPHFIRWTLSSRPIMFVLSSLGRLLFGKNYTRLSMQNYLSLIKNTPILFIHGKKDKLVPYWYLESMYYAAAHTPRCAFITPFEHTINHIKAKELYAHIVTNFIEYPDPNKLSLMMHKYAYKINY